MSYLRRTVDYELDELIPLASAIAIDGPKGVGKTKTAKRRADACWLLDNPEHLALARADPGFSSVGPGTHLIDEWQRFPPTWDAVRRQVDDRAPAGRFLLTGSATPNDQAGTHSGAGRIVALRMRPLAFYERGIAEPTVSLAALFREGHAPIAGSTSLTVVDYFGAIVASGFPGIFPQPERLRITLLDSYLQRVIDRDLPDMGVSVRRPETLRRWLAAYAAAESTTTSYSRILDATTAGDGTQPAKTTTISYRDHLARLWLLDPLPGWSPRRNPLSRLQQAPKHHLADPALSARLLGLSATALAGSTGAFMAGPLFESLAALTVRVAAQLVQGRVGHLRTRNGDHEVDIIVEDPDGRVLGIEVKLAAAITDRDVRHLLWLRDQLGDVLVDMVVVTTGTRAYRRPDGVAVVPLGLLGA